MAFISTGRPLRNCCAAVQRWKRCPTT